MTYLILFGYLSAYSFLTIAVVILSAVFFDTYFKDPLEVLAGFFMLSLIICLIFVLLSYTPLYLSFRMMTLLPIPIYIVIGISFIFEKY